MPTTNETDLLARVTARYVDGRKLTPTERAEVMRIAQGLVCKDSAARAGLSPETIRGHRKRLYKKLHVGGADHVICELLGLSLEMLARGDLFFAAQPTVITAPAQVAA